MSWTTTTGYWVDDKNASDNSNTISEPDLTNKLSKHAGFYNANPKQGLHTKGICYDQREYEIVILMVTNTQYRQVNADMWHLADCTRLDLKFVSCRLALGLHRQTAKHWATAKSTGRYIFGTATHRRLQYLLCQQTIGFTSIRIYSFRIGRAHIQSLLFYPNHSML